MAKGLLRILGEGISDVALDLPEITVVIEADVGVKALQSKPLK
ncbi:hypothetical protein [Tardiphaga sp. 11_C7_N12_6]